MAGDSAGMDVPGRGGYGAARERWLDERIAAWSDAPRRQRQQTRMPLPQEGVRRADRLIRQISSRRPMRLCWRPDARSAVKHRPADVVTQPLVIKYELENRLRQLGTLPLALEPPGLRQGELFGLTIDRLDFDARTVTVDRQLVNVNGRRPFFAPPKSLASIRIVPLPDSVIEALLLHLKQHPTDTLVFRNAHGEPLRRSAFWTEWRRATRRGGLPDIRFHELRHYYASLLIRHGESVKTVQARLGHASASETLDTYSHLWPDSDERTRAAVDLALGSAADYLRTADDAHRQTRRSSL